MSQQTSHGPFFFLMDNSALKQSFLHSYHQTFLLYHIIFVWLLTTTKIPLRCKSALKCKLRTMQYSHNEDGNSPNPDLRAEVRLMDTFTVSSPQAEFYCPILIQAGQLCDLWSCITQCFWNSFYLYKLSGLSTEFKKCSFVQASLSSYLQREFLSQFLYQLYKELHSDF